MEVRDRTVLVTGAASGMGRLAARRMADAGARVTALDRNEAGLRETAEGREGLRTRVCDVTDRPAVEAAVKEAETEQGPVERVYNAAAVMPTSFLEKQGADAIRQVMEVNYVGVVNVTMAVLPGFLERGRGELVNFASMAGWVPLPHFGAYNASKFAVVAFTEVLYHETRGRGPRICCVCPPPVDTPLLEQATSKPKILEQMPPIEPGAVLDEVERALARGTLWVFPGRGTRLSWWLRRFVPDLVWSRTRRLEGL